MQQSQPDKVEIECINVFATNHFSVNLWVKSLFDCKAKTLYVINSDDDLSHIIILTAGANI